ncbi:DUF2150 family protein [Halomarina oriensis]|uniref:DUF2150 family protein n=1 Tax=Halomarina oriensis TaxID=671145 RepID=A0A6B0GVP6_9EURY|nr:DUF2150 family protein [Halomarina oriensis]MWG35778.1 DUF2150 family protein [Halomarina oriensis]
MSTPEGEFYTDERWQNWLDRLDDEGVDLEDEDSARLRLNMQDDVVIAVAKIVSAYDDDHLSQEEAMGELEDVSAIVLTEIDQFDDEDTLMLVDAVQTAMVCVFHSAQEYVAAGPADEGDIQQHVEAAQAAETEEDLDTAHVHCVQAGTLILDGEEFEMDLEEMEYGLVAEWVNGLDSLYEAMRDPEVIEEDDE